MPGSNLDVLEKAAGIVSAVIGLVPPALTGYGYHWASIYNPPIYQHYELFLLVPAMVAIYTSYQVVSEPNTMTPIFCTAVGLAVLVFALYVSFPATSFVHTVNWILSYCVFALAVALVVGLLLKLRAT